MPATSKVLSIIDKGVQDRVTKNGETLRKHAESIKRWQTLQEKIERTEKDMETIRKILSMEAHGPDEFGSVSEGTSQSSVGHLATPSPGTHRRASGSIDATTSSLSPFRKFAKKLGGRVSGRSTPTSRDRNSKAPATDPLPVIHKRQSLFPLQGVTNLATPQRSVHKHSQSLMTPESPTIHRAGPGEETIKFKPPRWNSSTKVEDDESPKPVKTISRRVSTANMRASAGYVPPMPPISHNYPPRSHSRSSIASSRPWSPISNSAGSTTRTSFSRPSSRAQSPFGYGTSPRTRPKTPSHIPAPSIYKASSASSDASYEVESPPATSSILQRLSPSRSQSSTSGGMSSYGERAKTPLGTPYARPPSRSMIPVPTLQFSSASRPSSAMSNYNYDRPDTSMSFRSSAIRAQTPETTLRGRVRHFQDTLNSISAPVMSRRSSRVPPSSYRRESSTASASRPGSRAGAATPSYDSRSMHTYIPASTRDPLDVEVASIGNQ